jgi:predicted RNase H-like nuclease (RuvC/YqgF family)
MAQVFRGLFTKEFVVSIGGKDGPEIDEMVHMFNVLTSVWSGGAKAHMKNFIELVKSKTDVLSVALQQGVAAVSEAKSAETEPPPTTTTTATAPNKPNTEKSLLKEIDKLKKTIGELEQKCHELQTEVSALQTKNNELIKNSSYENMIKILASYSKRCRELYVIQDETARHSVRLNEQTAVQPVVRSDVDKVVEAKELEISELKSRMVTNRLQVLFEYKFTCIFI